MKRIFLFCLAGVLWISCQTSVPAQRNTSDNDLKRMQQAVNSEVNAYRAAKRLKPLQMVPIITDEAFKHSKNMARGRVDFGHDGFSKRTKRIMKQLENANAAAENVAYGQLSAKEVVQKWIESPGHRKNIEGNYNLTGIGIARGKDGYLYFTQMFINRQGL